MSHICEVCHSTRLSLWETLRGWFRRRPVACTFTNLAGAPRVVATRWVCDDCLARYACSPAATDPDQAGSAR